jgi:ribonuclease HI
MSSRNLLTIYTDGSSYSKPSRKGGAGFLFVTEDSTGAERIEEFELRGFEGSSSIQMELYACVAALKEVLEGERPTRYDKIVIKTDSMYIVDSYQSAIYEWSRNKWRNRHGRPIEHAQLWREMVRLLVKCRVRVTFKWVKGHSKDKHNKAADRLAKASAKGFLNKPLAVVGLRRKKSPLRVQRGCIAMRGQTEIIRIVTHQLLRQKEGKYRYEVINSKSADYQKVDIAYSKHDLRAGHEYEVVFNSSGHYPQIERVLREIVPPLTHSCLMK